MGCKKLGLVLGQAVQGLAHIGVIQVSKEAIPINLVVGSSMGQSSVLVMRPEQICTFYRSWLPR